MNHYFPNHNPSKLCKTFLSKRLLGGGGFFKVGLITLMRVAKRHFSSCILIFDLKMSQICIFWVLPQYEAWYWTNAYFLLRFIPLELNCVINQQRWSLFIPNLLRFAARNVRYPRYQDNDFLQLWHWYHCIT